MKSKKSLYILIPLAIIIWGLIIYRAVDMTSTSSGTITEREMAVMVNDTVLYKPLQKLKLNYNDPFLKRINTSGTEQKDDVADNMFFINPEPEVVEPDWPDIDYKGIIEKGNSNTGIIGFESKTFLVAEKDDFQKLIVWNIYRDSIVLKQGGKMKTYYKQK